MSQADREVVVVGGGPAGRTAAMFTARHDLDTLVLDASESILRRNAHLGNVPGFPGGVNPRRFLDLLAEQVEMAGADREQATVERVAAQADGLLVETAAGDRVSTEAVIAATKNEVDYLRGIDGVGIVDRGKPFVDVDERGRTGVDGLYAAGRLAEKPHQAVVCAGHGGEVAVTLLEDRDGAFYHDWTAPEGYFTDRGRDLPPGCEEIDADERAVREERGRRLLRERFADPHPDEQETHPSLED